MTLQDNLNMLHNHEAFAELVEEIARIREECISEMHSADIEKLSQISGRILAYDEITSLCGWESLKRRFPVR
tara:strand:+ start:493 stop:708 length:216 start_codon:yes stop_codon:yes gene_type:complete